MQSPMTCMFPNVVLGVLDEHLGDFRRKLLAFQGVKLASYDGQENVNPKKAGHKSDKQKLDELAKLDPAAFFPRWRRAALLSQVLQIDVTGMASKALKGILPDSIIGDDKQQVCSKPVPCINLNLADLDFSAQQTLDLMPRMGL